MTHAPKDSKIERKPQDGLAQSFPASGESLIAAGAQAQTLPAGLYLVATPIGNLRDITLRALDILRGADVIYAEDTRQTGKLLSAYDISARMTAYHDHNAAKRVPGIVAQIEDGKSVALVSDAGTPLVSDPGFKLARAVADAGLDIIPIPGASAALAGLLTSALPSDKFLFAGFLPPKSAARKTALSELATIKATLIFFEAGTRVDKTLNDMLSVLGDRPAALARELTKHYEETRRGTLSELITSVNEDAPRGEIVLVIGGAGDAPAWDAAKIDAALMALIKDEGVKRAANIVAEQSGVAKREVYARALNLK
ncbi:MAG: 16S rRNA (cytidine(1402)-2'-O)-methyltransferase [Robiginitomaculum sp.]